MNTDTDDDRMTTDEMREQYEVVGFQAPFVVVRRKADGQLGSLQFTHQPRVYFGWALHDNGGNR